MNYCILLLSVAFISACQSKNNANPSTNSVADTLRYEEETHLQNIRQLTFGGNNAEAYFSFNDSLLVFQSDNSSWDVGCDQIFYTPLSGTPMSSGKPAMVSTGMGRTTCSFFMPGDSTVVYASTHLADTRCPEVPDRQQGDAYVWPIYEGYDIFTADLQGHILDTLTTHPGYDAEATVSPQGDKIVFTSTRSGDLELYTMDIDGSNIVQITDQLGYDGGAFFSPDGSKLIFRASRPETDEEIQKYKELLSRGLVEPTEMELFVVDVDGKNLRQITDLGGANWAPYFHPSGEKVIFSSNHASRQGFPFNLYIVNIDGTGLKQITFDNQFDAFPMFSYDGSKLIFSSNRFNGGDRSTNIFIAEWVD